MTTDEIIEMISNFKGMQDSLKFEKEEAKKRQIKSLKDAILQRGEKVKEFLKICNHLAKCDYSRKSTSILNKMYLYIDEFNLLDGCRLDIYTESSVITDHTARYTGNTAIKTSGDGIIIHPNFSSDDTDELIKHLKQFIEDLDRTLKMFYLNLGDKLGIDLVPYKSRNTDILTRIDESRFARPAGSTKTDIDKICQAAGLTKIDDVIADIEKA
jgi:hypothetical protein